MERDALVQQRHQSQRERLLLDRDRLQARQLPQINLAWVTGRPTIAARIFASSSLGATYAEVVPTKTRYPPFAELSRRYVTTIGLSVSSCLSFGTLTERLAL